jgi:hypothetical protein
MLLGEIHVALAVFFVAHSEVDRVNFLPHQHHYGLCILVEPLLIPQDVGLFEAEILLIHGEVILPAPTGSEGGSHQFLGVFGDVLGILSLVHHRLAGDNP